MPESRPRKRLSFSPPRPAVDVTGPRNPRWLAPAAVTLMVLGLLAIVVAYVTQLAYPVPGIGPWNIAAGFAVSLVGFALITRWR